MSRVKKGAAGKKDGFPPLVTWVGGVLGGAAAVAGCVLTIMQHRSVQKPQVEVYYYRVKPEAITSLGTARSAAFAGLGAGVRWVENQCLQEARSRCSEKAVRSQGETVLYTYFVGVKNAQDVALAEVSLIDAVGKPTILRDIPPLTGVLLCYEMQLRGTTGPHARFLAARYRSARGGGSLELKPPDAGSLWTVGLDSGRDIGMASPPSFEATRE